MITKEMIKNGFETGKVSVETEYAGCMGICCKIGDNAFYFLDSEDDSITKEEYWRAYTLDMTIDMIFDILKSVESAEEHGIDCEERFYYEAVLTEIYSGKVEENRVNNPCLKTRVSSRNSMNKYIDKIEELAACLTISQSDGYAQILRLCQAAKEEEELMGISNEETGK